MKKITTFILTLVVAVPLFTDNKVFLPEVTTKSFLLAVLVVIAMVLFVLGLWFSKSMRGHVFERVKLLVKNPLVIAVTSFIGVYIVAALLAVDKSSAFWGTLSRSEGVMGMLYFFIFFVLLSLVFEKDDWIKFFKGFLVIAGIVVFKEFLQVFHGSVRPESFIGNTAFLAQYLVFGIFSAWVVIAQAVEKWWRIIAWIMIPLFLVGVLFTQTRGTMLGIATGIIGLLAFGIYHGKEVVYKKISLRMISAGLIIAGILFSGIFITTRTSDFWQSIPGFSRIAKIGTDDNTTNSRLLVWKVGLDSVSPKNESLKKLLIGWGPENFYLAFQKYYDPDIFSDDIDMFDRPHNKLIEVLVATGIVGLVVYLAIWFFLVGAIRKIPDIRVRAGMYFVGIAYFVHLMFLFDVVITSVCFMMLLGYAASFPNSVAGIHRKNEKPVDEDPYVLIPMGVLGLVLIVGVYVFFTGTVSGYSRMHSYVSLVTGNSAVLVSKQVPELLAGGETYVDALIIGDFLNGSAKKYNVQKNEQTKLLLDTAINLGDDYILKNEKDYRLIVTMVNALNSRGDTESLIEAQRYITMLIAQSPKFPRYQYMIGLNLGYQKKFDEAEKYFDGVLKSSEEAPTVLYQYAWILVMQGPKYYDRALDIFEQGFTKNPNLFNDDLTKNRAVYKVFTEYFAYTKDKVRLGQAETRLELNKNEK